MPRVRKTQTGAPAQPLASIPGQMYGAGVEQQRLQQQMPAPQVQPATLQPAVARQAPPQAAVSAAPARQQMDVMQAAAAMRDRTGLLHPDTARPLEPVTTGLTQGPGAGPEVLTGPKSSPLGDTLRMLSDVLGDQYFRSLAQKANL